MGALHDDSECHSTAFEKVGQMKINCIRLSSSLSLLRLTLEKEEKYPRCIIHAGFVDL